VYWEKIEKKLHNLLDDNKIYRVPEDLHFSKCFEVRWV